MKVIEQLLEFLSRGLLLLAAAALALMLVNVVLDVGLKYLLNWPVPGTAEIVAKYYMVAAVFLPLPLVELKNLSISVDLFYERSPNLVRRAMLTLAFALQAVFFFVLADQSFVDALSAYQKREFVEGLINVFVWPGRFALPIGFGLACLISVLKLAKVLFSSDWALTASQSHVDAEGL